MVVILRGNEEEKFTATTVVWAVAFVVTVTEPALASGRHLGLGKSFIGGLGWSG